MAAQINKQTNASQLAKAIAGTLTRVQADLVQELAACSGPTYNGAGCVRNPAYCRDGAFEHVTDAMRDIGLAKKGYKQQAVIPTAFGRMVAKYL